MTKVVLVNGEYLAIINERQMVETRELPKGINLGAMGEVEYDQKTGQIIVDGQII
ncbi:hypothetical protein M2M59_09045 [Rummeliibacillus sp. G93]|mgnify:CR=1 FL=1|uniref:hypothetical protein n=1 Tax=Rummeliibacillus TaxID=648802 RepID=UPI00116ECCE5|nr:MULTISPECIES: hypothetical protein [Rummeliibacillus]MBB5169084.1 hypothetical protein [Rummeliibacillus stabekisii]MCM3316633.1 hypothetical protein [Rummeliibacillus stabekisii]UQW96163.1 hypothetical protein M2M59_09045 [Rummeliibacillus sp. G93]GEL06434.1 hypothetical protein RST01_30610 [Rummeliibacillus stabekisii]